MPEMWYEVVSAEFSLMQGDLIFDCPLITWRQDELELCSESENEALKEMIDAISADVIVMTQACDLENNKVSNVILCPHRIISEFRELWDVEMRSNDQNPTEKAWKRCCDDICDGYIWNLAMLNSCDDERFPMEHRIVDFHDVYTVPRVFLESLLRQRGQPRLRLLAPYREHLSQAFARFFMRVGLPTAIIKAW